MQKYKCTISYDGTLFSGYQVQPNKRTIQSEIEKALGKMHKGQEIKITASGRTDAGVHAKGQVFHFQSPLAIPLPNWEKGLNAMLPDDISVLDIEQAASDFHARFDAVGKEYRYFLSRAEKRDPFSRNYAYYYPFPLNYDVIREAAQLFIGTHDFTSFCSAKTEVVDKIRTIREIEFYEEDDKLIFKFVGNGFLYNMVRIIMGTLLEAGSGKKSPAEMRDILDKKDRGAAGKTAPGHGLYLWKVHY
ncbi:tRNA pseudouridine(38-40) synthase TruA [Peribacillus saganii]|uniref:tRNA pseudouridine synthase A n=1 Tax=Peribacillus saganii TaxID=2303992 RepID=A0A372LPM5_9BACI|nr:tRNA pseudouridine(38-40) synthase TruA [Peribacillus saganii]RFU68596.1 tRNA pseudouridine(38-40) synthase TruA [Peribacillus saganii]